jgi:c-di-GMP-binding flagellar brake protein YcgR
MTIRATIARRRSVPANLRSLINPGLGVMILEAPQEYGLLIGDGNLTSPIVNHSKSGHSTPGTTRDSDSNPAQPPKVVAEQEPSPPKAPQAVSTASSPANNQRTAGQPAVPNPGQTSSHQIGGPKIQAPSPKPPPAATAVLVGGDELDEIADVLVEFGVETVYREPTDPQLQILSDTRLLIASARLAIANPIPVGGAATVSVAICDEVSETMRTMLQQQGFEYLIRQPVHIEALRLLVRYALFDQPDRRSRTRLPFGYEISWRMGWRRETGDLLDVSTDGCRLLASDSMPLHSRIHIKIPSEVGGGQALKLSGSVIRCSRHISKDNLERNAVGVAFDELSSKMREQLAHFCELWSDTLPIALNPDSTPSSHPKADEKQAPSATCESSKRSVSGTPTAEVPAVEAPADDESDPAAAERRRFPRGHLNREIVEVDADQRVVQALLGRDLSMGGIRIDPQFGLSVGGKLQLALFDTDRGEPLVLHAVVVRDDGGSGLVLHFVDLSAENEEHLGNMIAALPALESLGVSGDSVIVPTGILSEDGSIPTP